MYYRILSLFVFLGVLTGAFVMFHLEDPSEASAETAAVTETEAKKALEADYDRWWKEKEAPLEGRLTFRKKLAVVHVGELNTDFLYGKRLGDLAEHTVTINPDTRSMYFYRQDSIPQPADTMVLIHDVYSLDVLLGESVHKTSGTTMNFTFTPFQQPDKEQKQDYGFIQEARLFNNQSMTVTQAGEAGAVTVQFDTQTRTVQPGETAVFDKKTDLNGIPVRSKVVVSHYGLWDSQNVKYIAAP